MKTAGDKEKGQAIVVTVEPDGSDAWRLDQIVDMIKDGAVSDGVILIYLISCFGQIFGELQRCALKTASILSL